MAKDPAFLFYPGDYLRDTQCLSEKTQVAYDRIMCEHMRNICITQEQLNFFIKRLSEEEKKEIFLLLKKIKGGYCIDWVAESISKRMAYSESRRKNKEGKTKNISKSYVNHMENAIENVNEDEIKNKIGPEILEIERVFIQQGGTKEMALAFKNRHDATNWKIRGSSIFQWPSLIPSFIINWNENKKNGTKSASASNSTYRSRQNGAMADLISELGNTIAGSAKNTGT